MNFQALIGLVLVFISGTSHSVKFTFTNKCSFTVWPGTLTGGGGSQLSSTGFDLPTGASSSLDVRAPWSGRLWGRSQCSTDASGKFTCATGDCGSGQLTCNGAGEIPPASLMELTLAPNGGLDFYDVSLVDGFNLPVMLAPQGGSGDCKSTSCAGNVNTVCPPELSVRRSDGSVIACKSACMALNRPEYCCTGAFGLPTTCPATNYSQIFKTKCPEAYSYAYDDQTSTFTCSGGPNYVITFCP